MLGMLEQDADEAYNNKKEPLLIAAGGCSPRTTDDADVAGNIVAVTSRVRHLVIALHADNTQRAPRPASIEMDPAVAEVKMRAAEAVPGVDGARGARQFRRRRFLFGAVAPGRSGAGECASDDQRRSGCRWPARSPARTWARYAERYTSIDAKRQLLLDFFLGSAA